MDYILTGFHQTMYAPLHNFSQQSGGTPFQMPGLTNNYQPFGYSSEPERVRSNISLDDIIGALQNARVEKMKLEQKVASVHDQQPKPLDLNRGTTMYLVAHKAFATGNVWQPDTVLLPDERAARFEMSRLQRTNPEQEYKLAKLDWTFADTASHTKKDSHDHPTNVGFQWDYGDQTNDNPDDDDISFDHVPEEEENVENSAISPDEDKRFVFRPRNGA